MGSDRSPGPLPAEAGVLVTVSALGPPDCECLESRARLCSLACLDSPPGLCPGVVGGPNVPGCVPRAGGLSQLSPVLQMLCGLPPGVCSLAPEPCLCPAPARPVQV